VAGQQDLGSVVRQVLQGGAGSADAGVIGDGAGGLVHWHVQVRSDQHALALQIGPGEVAHGHFGGLHLERGSAEGGAGVAAPGHYVQVGRLHHGALHCY